MWKEDTAKSIQQAFTIDWENTKISKLIKDSVDLMRTREFMAQNYDLVKQIYLEMQYNSVYPFVNKLETASFCERAKLVDEVLNTSNCDLLFVSSTSAGTRGIKQKTGLVRCEFLEYIVRLANFKYVQSGKVQKYHEAVKIVMDDFVKPNLHLLPW